MRATPRLYDLTSAALAAALSGFELIRLAVAGHAQQPNTVLAGLIGAIGFCAVLAIAAVGLALHRPSGWVAGVFGVIAAASYGIFLRAGGYTIGALYILLAPVLMALIIKDLHGYTTTEAPAEA
jgi:hypothetical protein